MVPPARPLADVHPPHRVIPRHLARHLAAQHDIVGHQPKSRCVRRHARPVGRVLAEQPRARGPVECLDEVGVLRDAPVGRPVHRGDPRGHHALMLLRRGRSRAGLLRTLNLLQQRCQAPLANGLRIRRQALTLDSSVCLTCRGIVVGMPSPLGLLIVGEDPVVQHPLAPPVTGLEVLRVTGHPVRQHQHPGDTVNALRKRDRRGLEMPRGDRIVVLVILLRPALRLLVYERRLDPVRGAKERGEILDLTGHTPAGQHHLHLVLRGIIVEFARVLILALGGLADVLFEVPVMRPRASGILRLEDEREAALRRLPVLFLSGQLVQQHQKQRRMCLYVILKRRHVGGDPGECVGFRVVDGTVGPASAGTLYAHQRGGGALRGREVARVAQRRVANQQLHRTGRAVAILRAVEVVVSVWDDDFGGQKPHSARPCAAERPAAVLLLQPDDVIEMAADDPLVNAARGIIFKADGLDVSGHGPGHDRSRVRRGQAGHGRLRRRSSLDDEVVNIAVEADGLVVPEGGRCPQQQAQPRGGAIADRTALEGVTHSQPRCLRLTVPPDAHRHPAIGGQVRDGYAGHDRVRLSDLEAALGRTELGSQPRIMELVGAKDKRVVAVLVEQQPSAIVRGGR